MGFKLNQLATQAHMARQDMHMPDLLHHLAAPSRCAVQAIRYTKDPKYLASIGGTCILLEGLHAYSTMPIAAICWVACTVWETPQKLAIADSPCKWV